VTTLISFPFRLSGSGSVTTRDDGDLDYLGEELAQLIRTNPGERELVPTYGVNDPAFSTLDEGMLASQVDTFGPPIVIESVTTRFLSDTIQDVVVAFRPEPGSVNSALGDAGDEGSMFVDDFDDDEDTFAATDDYEVEF
jgi:hypothetical protein